MKSSKKMVGKTKQMCYDKKEVNPVEEQNENQTTQQPRPRWQVWGARVLLVVFVIFLIMYYINVMRGGL